MELRLRWLVILFIGLSIMTTHGSWAQEYPIQPERAVTLNQSIDLFPNPATEYVHIRTSETSISSIRFSLHNIIGNKIEAEAEVLNEHELRIRVKDLAIGYYLITIRDMETNRNGTFKFVKK